MVRVRRSVLGNMLISLTGAHLRSTQQNSEHLLLVFRLMETRGGDTPPGLETIGGFVNDNGPFLNQNYELIQGLIEVDHVMLESILTQAPNYCDEKFDVQLLENFKAMLFPDDKVAA